MTSRSVAPFHVLAPRAGDIPVLLSSPHSGVHYPEAMHAGLALPVGELRPLEDGPVDRIIDDARDAGATLILARYARAYVDLNRDPSELDPALLGLGLEQEAWRASSRARAGLGVVPSRIGSRSIYRRAQLSADEVEERLVTAYHPYHDELRRRLDRQVATFGRALLLDCHSMPSFAGRAGGEPAVDIALGDRFGRSCDPALVDLARRVCAGHGLVVARNRPYAGGFITEHYGRPEHGVHALQLEMRRGLFMSEATHVPHAGLLRLRALLRLLTALLGEALAGVARAWRPADALLAAG